MEKAIALLIVAPVVFVAWAFALTMEQISLARKGNSDGMERY